MNERAILLIALRIGIILLVTSMLYDASYLFSMLLNWQDGTDKSFYMVNATAVTIILVLAVGFWFFPSTILGPYVSGVPKADMQEVNASKLFAGFLALLGVYFLVQSGPKLISAISTMIFFASGDSGGFHPANLADLISGFFVLIAGFILIVGRAPIARFITKLRGM